MTDMDERRAIDSLRQHARKLIGDIERGERDDLPERVLELAEFIWEGYDRELEYSRPLRDARRGRGGEDTERITEDYKEYLSVEQLDTWRAAEELAELMEGAMR